MGRGGDEDPPDEEKRRKPNTGGGGANQGVDESFYKPYTKPGYKRVFPADAVSADFTVFVESTTEEEKLGNRNPLLLANLFKNEIKGVINIRRLNASKVGVVFQQSIHANNFLKNEEFLNKHGFKAHIPAKAVETIGVVRFVPTSISNEELFRKLTSSYEVVGVRRFMRRVNGELKPYGCVSVTFLANNLPDCVYLDIYRYNVDEYVAPLLQCYKCFRFNHGAKICKATQKCSICSEEHHYTQCTNPDEIKCINCKGPHMAISRDCPVKKMKIQEKHNRVTYANAVTKTFNPMRKYEDNFPNLPTPPTQAIQTSPNNNVNDAKTKKPINFNNTKQTTLTKPIPATNKPISKELLIEEVLKNESILKALVGALVTLGNSNQACTMSRIKDVLIDTFKNG